MTIHESVTVALKALLDDAERRNYDPPVPSQVVAELEWAKAALEHTISNIKSRMAVHKSSAICGPGAGWNDGAAFGLHIALTLLESSDMPSAGG